MMSDLAFDFAYHSSRRRLPGSRYTVRIERECDDVIVSPVLGSGRLCQRCWLHRRAAAANPAALAGQSPDPDLVTAFQRQVGTAGAPSEPLQRARLARTLLQCRVTAGQPSGGEAPHLTRIRPGGYARAEPVLPLPACESCWAGPDELGPPDVAHLIGETAGIVNDISEVPAAEGEPAFPQVMVTRLANVSLNPRHAFGAGASGKGATRSMACRTAVAESIERYAASLPPREVVIARCEELDNPVTPAQLTGVGREQALAAGYDEEGEFAWVRAQPAQPGGQARWVPAAAVYLSLPAAHRRRVPVPMTTNGLACRPDLPGAVAAGVAEIIERHEFFAVWYGLKPATSAGAVVAGQAAREFARCGIELHVTVLGERCGVVVAAASCWPIRPDAARPGFALGLGTGADIQAAADSAVLEAAQVYRGLTWALRNESMRERIRLLAAGAVQPAEPYDHGLLYACRSPETVPAPFGLGSPRAVSGDHPAAVMESALYVDITPVDVLQAGGLRVVRAVVPGAIPFHYGTGMVPWNLLRLPKESSLSLDTLHPLS
jgi:ribosomal protein S12 methylthiotransferase accessory factor YcaO